MIENILLISLAATFVIILTAVFVAFTGDYTMAVTPFFATPITRVFL